MARQPLSKRMVEALRRRREIKYLFNPAFLEQRAKSHYIEPKTTGHRHPPLTPKEIAEWHAQIREEVDPETHRKKLVPPFPLYEMRGSKARKLYSPAYVREIENKFILRFNQQYEEMSIPIRFKEIEVCAMLEKRPRESDLVRNEVEVRKHNEKLLQSYQQLLELFQLRERQIVKMQEYYRTLSALGNGDRGYLNERMMNRFRANRKRIVGAGRNIERIQKRLVELRRVPDAPMQKTERIKQLNKRIFTLAETIHKQISLWERHNSRGEQKEARHAHWGYLTAELDYWETVESLMKEYMQAEKQFGVNFSEKRRTPIKEMLARSKEEIKHYIEELDKIDPRDEDDDNGGVPAHH